MLTLLFWLILIAVAIKFNEASSEYEDEGHIILKDPVEPIDPYLLVQLLKK